MKLEDYINKRNEKFIKENEAVNFLTSEELNGKRIDFSDIDVLKKLGLEKFIEDKSASEKIEEDRESYTFLSGSAGSSIDKMVDMDMIAYASPDDLKVYLEKLKSSTSYASDESGILYNVNDEITKLLKDLEDAKSKSDFNKIDDVKNYLNNMLSVDCDRFDKEVVKVKMHKIPSFDETKLEGDFINSEFSILNETFSLNTKGEIVDPEEKYFLGEELLPLNSSLSYTESSDKVLYKQNSFTAYELQELDSISLPAPLTRKIIGASAKYRSMLELVRSLPALNCLNYRIKLKNASLLDNLLRIAWQLNLYNSKEITSLIEGRVLFNVLTEIEDTVNENAEHKEFSDLAKLTIDASTTLDSINSKFITMMDKTKLYSLKYANPSDLSSRELKMHEALNATDTVKKIEDTIKRWPKAFSDKITADGKIRENLISFGNADKLDSYLDMTADKRVLFSIENYKVAILKFALGDKYVFKG